MNSVKQTQDSHEQAAVQARIRELEEDNRLLFDQLHVVQEELARVHDASSRAARLPEGGMLPNWVDDELPEALAENLRSRAILDVQKETYQIQAGHLLTDRLGDILIQGTGSPSALLSIPSRLFKVWRQERMQTPPNALGDQDFDKFVAAYWNGGLAVSDALLASVSVSPAMQASALTVLARSLMNSEPAKAAEIARRAYAVDPRPFRLKWLAFRLHEAGELIEAEAMLEVLPADVKFSDSEARQADRLRREARQARQHEAKQKCGFSSRRAEVERQLLALTLARDEQTELAEQRQRELARLAQARDEQAALAEQRQRDLVRLSQARDEQAALAKQRHAELLQLTEARDEQAMLAEQKHADLLRLIHARDEQAALAKQRQAELLQLTQARDEQAVLMEQKHADLLRLIHARDEQAVLAEQRQAELLQLIQTRDEQVALAERRQGELLQLIQTRDEQALLAVQRQGELLQFMKGMAELDKEKSAQELRQRQFGEQLELLSSNHKEHSKFLSDQVQGLAAAVNQYNGAVDAMSEKQTNDIVLAKTYLDSVIQNHVANSTKQIQSLVGLQSYYSTGELPTLNSERNTWPVSTDFSLYLVELIELNDYDLIIEFGSCISTVIVAKVLAKISSRRQGRSATRFISFDHLDEYYRQTRFRLAQAGLEGAVQLMLAPLQDWQAPNGNTYPYYSCEAELTNIRVPRGARILAIVDGPPAKTGKHARYPAGPLLLRNFAEAHIDILLDDYIRGDEKEIARLWQAEMQAAGRTYTVTGRKFEKDACLISVSPFEKQ